MKLIKTMKSLPMAVAAAAVLAALPASESVPVIGASAASAQEQQKSQQATRKVPAMTLAVHKKIQKAQEAMDLKNFAEATEILDDVLAGKANDYERAVTWQVKAMMTYEQDDTPGTIRAYQEILKYKDSIPEALETSIIYGLAQLYYSIEKYDESLEYVKKWEATVDPTLISVNNRVFIAQLYYTLSDFKTSLEYLYRAIHDAEQLDTVEVKETWYQLALSAHWELGEYTKVRDTLEILLLNWPNPRYWTQLAGAYQELGDETTSYALTEAAYQQGFLDDKPAQIVNVAQIQMARQAPIKCAWIMERGFKEKLIERDAKNEKILGQCYMLANEWGKAIKPMSVAAKAEKDGDIWLQVGQILMQLDRYDEAVDAFANVENAFKSSKESRAKDKRLTAAMQRGVAFTEMKKFSDAHKAFADAAKLASDKKERNTVRQWQNYLKSEEAREKMLTG